MYLQLAKAVVNSAINLNIPVRYVRHALIAVFFFMTFRTFQYLPGMSVPYELWRLLAFFFLIIPYLHWKIVIKMRFTVYELYLLFMIITIPTIASIAAWRVFGQPLIYGILSERNMILGVGALLIIMLFQRGRLTMSHIQGALVLLAWGTLSLYTFINWFVDPSSYVDYGEGLVGGGGVEPLHFKFQSVFIIFGLLFYALRGFRRKSARDWLLAVPFLGFLVIVDGGRSLLVSLVVTFSFFFFKWGSIQRLIPLIPKVVLAGFLFVVCLYVADSSYVISLAAKFGDAFTVAATGERTADPSANARIFESALALPYIKEHWLLGSGNVSNQWHGGYDKVVGGYFYPSDIGIIGVIYMYGIVGLGLFLIQYYFALRFSKIISSHLISSPLLDAVKAYLLYFTTHSLVTGGVVHNSEISFLFIGLLYCILIEARRNENSRFLYDDMEKYS